MKKLFLLLVIIFSFNNLTFAQLVCRPGISSVRLISFWRNRLSSVYINSVNTSIQKWRLCGENYYLIYGEAGCNVDLKPLLVRPVNNRLGFTEVGNLYPQRDYLAGVNYVSVFNGYTLVRVKFFREARFLGYIWRKFPYSYYWRSRIRYRY